MDTPQIDELIIFLGQISGAVIAITAGGTADAIGHISGYRLRRKEEGVMSMMQGRICL